MDKQYEEELKNEYENYLNTKSGQEWKEDWIRRMPNTDDAGSFEDYLYDFYPEELM